MAFGPIDEDLKDEILIVRRIHRKREFFPDFEPGPQGFQTDAVEAFQGHLVHDNGGKVAMVFKNDLRRSGQSSKVVGLGCHSGSIAEKTHFITASLFLAIKWPFIKRSLKHHELLKLSINVSLSFEQRNFFEKNHSTFC